MQIKDEIYKTNYRSSNIQSCTLNKEDLKKLCDTLKEKHNEAIEHEVKEFKYPDNVTNEDKIKIENSIKKDFKMSVHIIGINGKTLIGEDSSIFEDKDFPEELSFIGMSNFFTYKFFKGYEPKNSFNIRINIFKTSILCFSYPIEPIESTITVSGSNETWVTATYQKSVDFLNTRKNNRNWLHKSTTWDLFLYLLIFPITFWITYRIDNYIRAANLSLSIVLLIATYFYTFILILLSLRILFNYSKWMFPLIEYHVNTSKISRHRKFLYFILGGLFLSVLYDIIKGK